MELALAGSSLVNVKLRPEQRKGLFSFPLRKTPISKRDETEKHNFISNHMCCVLHRELYREECLSRQAEAARNGNLNLSLDQGLDLALLADNENILLIVGSPVRIQMLLWYLIYLLKSCVCLYFVRKKPEMLILEILKLPNPGVFEVRLILHENRPLKAIF